MRGNCLVLTVMLFGLAAPVQAEVKLNPLFQNNMVLQRGPAAPVWGQADPEEKVTVKLNGQEVAAVADKNGKWEAVLKDLKAGGPHEMTIQGANTITLKNVMIGEVWVASGQSNMEWTVNSCDQTDKNNAKSAPKNSNLRMFTVGRIPQEKSGVNIKGSWVEASPDTVGGFSAVAYFFGRELQEKLNVPVGMINTSWGGTRAEAWTSREDLKKLAPNYAKEVETHELAFANNPKVSQNPNAPSVLYNGMLKPLAPFAIKGFIWYQGESNTGRAYQYEALFGTMINNWRADWQNPTLPFYFVQLAPFTKASKQPGESTWAELRETQRQTQQCQR